MQIDLQGHTAAVIGERNAIAEAALSALLANGATVGERPQILLVSLPLLPADGTGIEDVVAEARVAARSLAAGEAGGRVVFLLSALAGLPTRRQADYSVAMAGALAAMRTLAMELAPHFLVNAVGIGTIGDPPRAGDPEMLSHAALSRPGTVTEVVDTILFFCDPMNTYTTGQMLAVDGGWNVGYGRNF